ncbi:MAG: ABC transporter substrate-binding protein [Alphaproteobacteria bacterium]
MGYFGRVTALTIAALGAVAQPSGAQELRLGFLTTLSSGSGIVGRHQLNGWQLGLEHEGWRQDGDRLGGVPTRVFVADDRAKPDVAVSAVEKLTKQDKVHLVAGIIRSNLMMAVQRPVFEAGVGLIATNAGPSPLAGELCNPLFVSTSWQSDQPAEALGTLVSKENVASIYLLAPNYQGGRDLVAGLTRTLENVRVVGQDMFKLGETDFQAEISKVRAAKPAAVFVFAPDAMGPAFVKQWAASGLNREIRLYATQTIDWVTLPAIGDPAIGAFETIQWSVDLDNETNRRFVRDYVAKYGHTPSNFAQQSYDAPRLVAAAVKAVGGKVDDIGALMRAMRKTPYPSARGPYQYNVNGIPIQNFYKVEVVKGADGRPTIVNRGVVSSGTRDAYWGKCPPEKRF